VVCGAAAELIYHRPVHIDPTSAGFEDFADMLKNLLNRIRPIPPVKAPGTGDIAAADELIVEGNRQEDAGNGRQAEALYRAAAAKAPHHARAHLNLGIVLAALGDTEGAAKAYEAVLSIDPHHPFGNYNFARLAFLRGEMQQAETLVREALRAKPEFPEALVVLANVLDSFDKIEPAVHAMEAALRLQPDNAGGWFNLSLLLLKLKRLDASEAAVKRVLDLDPKNAVALAVLGRLWRDHGFATQALEPLREAILRDPANLSFRSQELLLLNFEEEVQATDLFRRHVEFGAQMEQALPPRFDRFLGSDEADRRLRVGYVSCDFCLHPVSLFFLPVIERHDRTTFEIFCYSTGPSSDQITRRVRDRSDRWIDAEAMTDSQLADAIHADAIDILVDLTGHTNLSRLGVFSQRPAPVQATWLGYLNTTGLARMNYRLSDRRSDPAESSQPFHTERLVPLPNSQWCYRPFLESTVSPTAPLERNGYVTFGSFNDSLKLTPAMCHRWARLLSRVPQSRLIIANLGSERKKAAVRLEMTNGGISEDRFEFVPRVDLDKYPDLLSTVDISLDTFPYGGGTTTFDALWMGVPVITAVGDIPVSRSAASILVALGLDDWVAPSIDDFVDVAVARASDHQAIVSLRQSLRPRLKASPLTDEVQFVRDLEAAYRDMWTAYCK